jgi:hypothetical protein
MGSAQTFESGEGGEASRRPSAEMLTSAAFNPVVSRAASPAGPPARLRCT